MPLRAEPGQGHAVRVDAESVSRLHARLPLLLRAALPDAIRASRSDDEFASIILVKTNFVETLRAELDKPSWEGDYVVVGAATDCYQPIEGYYKLTRGSLEALCEHRNLTGHHHQGTDDRARHGCPAADHRPRRLQRLHQRASRGRRCVAAARTRNRASDAAAEGGARAR